MVCNSLTVSLFQVIGNGRIPLYTEETSFQVVGNIGIPLLYRDDLISSVGVTRGYPVYRGDNVW